MMLPITPAAAHPPVRHATRSHSASPGARMTAAGLAALMLVPTAMLSPQLFTPTRSHRYAPAGTPAIAPVVAPTSSLSVGRHVLKSIAPVDPRKMFAHVSQFAPFTDTTPARHSYRGTEQLRPNSYGELVLPRPDACNCFSFAWHNGRGDRDDDDSYDAALPRWDHAPEDDVRDSRRLDPGERARVGDVVLYGMDGYSGDVDRELEPSEVWHATVVVDVDRKGRVERVVGKEGAAQITDHHPSTPNKVFWTMPESREARPELMLAAVWRPNESANERAERVEYVFRSVGRSADEGWSR
jgi:hypothetical protein